MKDRNRKRQSMMKHNISMLSLVLIVPLYLAPTAAFSQSMPMESYQQQPEYKYQSESYDDWNNMSQQQRDEYREQLVQERLKGMPRGEQQRYYRERGNAQRRLLQGNDDMQNEYVPRPQGTDPARGMSF